MNRVQRVKKDKTLGPGEQLIKEMQKLGSEVAQGERKIKKRKMERMKLGKDMAQFTKVEHDLQDKKKAIFREKRKLGEQDRQIKWRLEEIKREESRTAPEIDRTQTKIKKLQNKLTWHDADTFNIQGEHLKSQRKYRQLLKKRQEMLRKQT